MILFSIELTLTCNLSIYVIRKSFSLNTEEGLRIKLDKIILTSSCCYGVAKSHLSINFGLATIKLYNNEKLSNGKGLFIHLHRVQFFSSVTPLAF